MKEIFLFALEDYGWWT